MLQHGVSTLLLLMAISSPADTVVIRPGEGATFRSESGDASLTIGGRLQARHTYVERGVDSSYFHLPRVELSLKGAAYRAWTWEFMADFGKKEKATIKDAFVERAFGESLSLRFGQHKVGFDRQQSESSGRQTFAEASIATSALGKGRDLGVQLNGAVANKRLRYNAGLYNGTGEGTPNTNTGHMAVGRLSLQPLGDFGVTQGDLGITSRPLVALDAAGYLSQDDGGSPDGTMGVAVGGGVRFRGLYAVGEYLRSQTSADSASSGYYAQLNYMVIPGLLQLAARYAALDPHEDAGDDARTETTLGVNVFFNNAGHRLKLTGDASILTDEAIAGSDNPVIRTRLQFQADF